MTTGTGAKMPAWRLQWAAAQLGVDPGADPAEVRAAFRARLAAVDFVPPAAWREALLVLTERAQDLPLTEASEEGCLAWEERTRSEVEKWISQFWTLPADERRREWDQLIEQCQGYPPLLERLRLVEPGLAIELPKEAAEGSMLLLAEFIQQLFLLRPAGQAAARFHFFSSNRGTLRSWQKVATALQKRHPDIASLCLGFTAELINWTDQQTIIDARHREILDKQKPATERGRLGWTIAVAVAVLLLKALLFSGPIKPSPFRDRTAEEQQKVREDLERLQKVHLKMVNGEWRAEPADGEKDAAAPQHP